MPKKLKIGPYKYSVSKSNLNEHVLDGEGKTYGITHVMEQTMVLAEGQGPDMLAESLLHEVLHICCQAAGLGLELENEESIVSSIAPVLLEAIRNNPDMVEFIVDG